jgi:DNA-binding SARP family transcriptional activator
VLVLTAMAELGDATAATIAAHAGMTFPTATAKLIRWEHGGHATTVRGDTGQTLWRLTDTGHAFLGSGTDLRAEPEQPQTAPTGTTPVADNPPDLDPAADTTDQHEPDQQTPAGPGTPAPTGPVEVDVLGEPRIIADHLDRAPRRKALELLVYLAVHDGSATTEQILDDLLPDAPAAKAPQRLHTYVSDLRNVMRRIGGPGTYLTHPQHRYVLNSDLVDVDLWRMRTALREAGQTTDPQQRITALRRAVSAYRGPLADGTDYEWAEPYREAIRRQALDAHLDLADALTDPTERVHVLDTAITHSPYSEEVYRQAMRARAELGDADAIRALRRAVGRAMAAIDAEASNETIRVSDQLITDLEHRNRPTTTHPAAES